MYEASKFIDGWESDPVPKTGGQTWRGARRARRETGRAPGGHGQPPHSEWSPRRRRQHFRRGGRRGPQRRRLGGHSGLCGSLCLFDWLTQLRDELGLESGEELQVGIRECLHVRDVLEESRKGLRHRV